MQGFERAKRDSSQAQNDKKQIIKSQPRLHTPSPEATPLFLEKNKRSGDIFQTIQALVAMPAKPTQSLLRIPLLWDECHLPGSAPFFRRHLLKEMV